MPESGTVKIANLVSKLKQEGRNVISFSMGEPDFPTPENIREAAKRALDEGFTHYTPSAGIPELRELVAEKSVKENNIPCTASNVLITPSKHAIFMSMLAMVDEGDEVIIPDPAWGTYDASIRLAGGKPTYAVLEEDNGFRMNPEVLAELITPRTSMIVVNSPSNPAGSVFERDDIKGIADLAKDHDLTILSDEVYEHIIYEGEPISMASVDGMFERTITVNGFSKTYAMTGWRLGWLVAPPAIFKEFSKLQSHSVTCGVSFAQKGAVEALKGPQDSVASMKEEFRIRRDLVCDLIDEIPSLHCARPKGAFYIFPSYDFEINSEDFCTYLLENANVGVTPGTAFGPNSEGHFRISYAASREALEEGLIRIKEALSRL
ncbi:MAG TPA: pyridoxal phosphate-dependent aminotransferase [Methanomassiliicoccales archaeon]|nr:pyridoxal phosphate-dependent aminotransferase [Methanomassiliicoccales archaeon]